MRGVTRRAVVEHVVDEDVVDLGHRVAVVGIGENAAVPRHRAAHRFRVRAKLLVGWIRVETMLKRYVGDGPVLPVVADRPDVVPGRELQRDVVEDDVARAVQAQGVVGVARGVAAGADADEAADDVVPRGEGDFAALEADAAAGRGLAGNGDVLAHGNRAEEIDVTADVEDHDPVGRADRRAERSRAAVGQRGDVVNRAGASAGGEAAKAERAGEGGKLGEQRQGGEAGQDNRCTQGKGAGLKAEARRPKCERRPKPEGRKPRPVGLSRTTCLHMA